MFLKAGHDPFRSAPGERVLAQDSKFSEIQLTWHPPTCIRRFLTSGPQFDRVSIKHKNLKIRERVWDTVGQNAVALGKVASIIVPKSHVQTAAPFLEKVFELQWRTGPCNVKQIISHASVGKGQRCSHATASQSNLDNVSNGQEKI